MSQEQLIEALAEYETVADNATDLMAFVEKWNPIIGREGGVVTEALGRVSKKRNEKAAK